MAKITYLFGAGASALAVPVVEKIPHEISLLISKLQKKESTLSENERYIINGSEIEDSKRYFQNQMIKDLIWLHENCVYEVSVDTFAKHLFNAGRIPELETLKITLSVLFAFIQARQQPDNRYSAFYSSIIDNPDSLPSNINILSWNYDYQFEISYSKIHNINDFDIVQRKLGIVTKNRINNVSSNFNIFKLNGSASLFSGNGIYEVPFTGTNIASRSDIEIIDEITKYYAIAILGKSMCSAMSFAWEEFEEQEKSILDMIKTNVQYTDVLVVIGYTFPFANRSIDRTILHSMKKLKKVYFQDLNTDIPIANYKLCFPANGDKTIVSYGNTNQFLIPAEVN